jgi:DNA-directed RNA polymerase subunit beta'
MVFYAPEEVIIAYNEELSICMQLSRSGFTIRRREPKCWKQPLGRVLFNQAVPDKAGYINELLTKKSLRDIIGHGSEENRDGQDSQIS